MRNAVSNNKAALKVMLVKVAGTVDKPCLTSQNTSSTLSSRKTFVTSAHSAVYNHSQMA